MTPAETLRRAADILERRSAAATPGPWDYTGCEAFWGVHQTDEVRITTSLISPQPRADAAWIATMSPAVAAPLVAWLRYSAPAVKMFPDHAPDSAKHALDFARAVLTAAGEES